MFRFRYISESIGIFILPSARETFTMKFEKLSLRFFRFLSLFRKYINSGLQEAREIKECTLSQKYSRINYRITKHCYNNTTSQLLFQTPINNPTAAAGFIGVKPTTKKNHLVRALLESLVLRVMTLYDCLLEETSFKYKNIR